MLETAGSGQTSSAIMLWVKTRVYVCSGRGDVGSNVCHPSLKACYLMQFTIPHKTLVTLWDVKGDIPQNAS